MMRRRAMPMRRGPGLVGTMARTAVIAGTATAVSKGVSGSMDSKAQAQQQQAAAQQAAAQQAAAQQAAQQTAAQNQTEMQEMQAQMEAMQAQQAQMAAQQAAIQAPPAPAPVPAPAPAPAAAAGGTDLLAQLTQLGQLKEAGVLNDEEFQAAKAKLLAP
jgi:ATPase subunit of ABC transporter with duplicated ATPase domains